MLAVNPDRDLVRGTPVEPRLLVPLLDAGALAPELVGEKARALGALLRDGYPVPGGLVLTTLAQRRFIESAGLRAELSGLTLSLRHPDARLPDEARLASVRERIAAAPVPAWLEELLSRADQALRSSGAAALAVRSSGAHEDLPGLSFAGLYESTLDVRGLSGVLAAVKRCWASTWTRRVLEYAQGRRSRVGDLAVAVLLQPMVRADASAVLFTVNPLAGREDEALVEATPGLGEPLVSGRAEPDRYWLDTGAGRCLHARPAPSREAPGEGGGGPVLTPAQLEELARLADDLQRRAGRPLDVELAYEDGQLRLLQARPITALQHSAVEGEWTTANFREGGVSAGACTPLLASLYEAVFEQSLPAYLREIGLLRGERPVDWMRCFFSRPYWNVGEVKRLLAQNPGYRERDFDLDLGNEPDSEGGGTTTPITVLGVLRALPVLFGLQRSYRRVLEEAARAVAAFRPVLGGLELEPDALAALDRGELVSRYVALVEERYLALESLYFTTVYNTSNAKLDFNSWYRAACRVAGETLSYSKLMGGLGDVSHLRPIRDAERLAWRLRGAEAALDEEAVQRFARRWQHRGSRELDPTAPRWGERPSAARRVLEDALERAELHAVCPPPPRDPEQEHASELQRAMRALALRPHLAWLFRTRLERLRQYAYWREEMKDVSTCLHSLLRQWTEEIGRRLTAEGCLAEAGDVWYLSWAELRRALDGRLGRAEAAGLVRGGRRRMERFGRFDAPHQIRGGSGRSARSVHGAAPAAGPFTAPALQGAPCSHGVAEGVARVARTVEEAEAVSPGEVLVALYTDPGWTPVFARCGAAVVERGGLLSHAAVIAREYGIPAVLGVPDATRALRSGDRVRVDGDTGEVTILQAAVDDGEEAR